MARSGLAVMVFGVGLMIGGVARNTGVKRRRRERRRRERRRRECCGPEQG